MRDLCSVLGISLEDVIAIGDNYNDLPMLAEVGHPWIMKNSALDQAGFGQSHEFLRAESVERNFEKALKGRVTGYDGFNERTICAARDDRSGRA